LAKARVLVVEDEALVARDLVSLVKSLGYEVTDLVQNGEAVVQSVEKNLPDLAIMDIVLKGQVDGIEAAAILWEKYSIPVVYLTSFADDLTFQRAKLTEPFGYLIKPYEERELELTIEIALYKARVQQLLKEREQWLSTILTGLNDGIIVSNEKGRITFINPSAQRITGWKELEAIEQPVDRVFDLKEKIDLQSGLALPDLQEASLKTKNGQEIPVELTMSPLPEPRGGWRGQVVVFRDVSTRRQAEQELQESWAKLQRALKGTIEAISITIEMRDPYTAGHQRRVAHLAEAIATKMNLPTTKIEGIKFAAQIHDIGKIYVPAEILSKPTKLTELEYTIIKTHPQAGYEILKNIEFPWPIADIVLQHHERLDGSGYPAGLKDGEILLEARILAVADVVEAMSSHRPYRPSFGLDKAMEEINLNSEILYDPQAVAACQQLLFEKALALD
jgi:PAS domain S-box-containing protein/putative nucleotidyltransferase with HDIG domain